jgi:hypothetical protein
MISHLNYQSSKAEISGSEAIKFKKSGHGINTINSPSSILISMIWTFYLISRYSQSFG